jgi:UDP-glucose 4-epimerase
LKYLITGGAGFIGSHLAENLIARGDSVVILDNFSTGSEGNLSNIKSKIDVKRVDILNQKKVDKYVRNTDFVIHLAAALGVFNIVSKPLESLKVNLQGTEILLESASRYKKPFLLASTSEIYGKNTKIPLNEEDDRIVGHPLKSRWSYSEAKAVDESLAFFYFQEKKLPTRIVRLFNTVGPRQVGHYGMVLPRFVDAALKNEPLVVYGSGNQVRCFCHVNDAVRALLLIIDSPKALSQVYNVGSDQQISVMDLAKKVIEITGSKSRINQLDYNEAYPSGFEDIQIRVPDISKIKCSLGWQPSISLDQIIKDVVAFNLHQ